jgi:outer membrane protein
MKQNFINCCNIHFGCYSNTNTNKKTAHVDVSGLWLKCHVRCSKAIRKLSGTYDTDYKKMVEEYQTKLKYKKLNLLQLQMLSTETVLKKFKICRKKIVDFRDNAQKELQQKESDIVKQWKLENSIQKSWKS